MLKRMSFENMNSYLRNVLKKLRQTVSRTSKL